MVDRTKTVRKVSYRGAVLFSVVLIGVTVASQELRAQSAWGGNSSVTVNESVLDSLGPARSPAGIPYQPQGGAYGGSYTRYGGALLFPPQQAPRSTLTVPPPSAEALRSVPPMPRSAPRATATARAQPTAPRATPQTAARPPAPAPAPAPTRPAAPPKQPPASSAPQVLAPPPPPPQPPQPPQPVAAAEPPKQEETAKPKPAPQTASTSRPTANGTPKSESGPGDAVEEMDLPPPAPLPSFNEQAEPMVPTVGLDSGAADAPRQTLFTGGPSPSGIVLGGAPTKPGTPAAPPPPPPTPEPVSADDAKQAAPLATGTPKTQPQPDDSRTIAAAPQPARSEQPSAPQTAAVTQQAALPPATAPTAGEVRIPFEQAQINLEESQQALLTPLADQLRNNDRLAVRVQAYASGEASDPNRARRLSLQRALKVRKFFIDQGIRSVRVEVRALGMSGPDGSVDRVDVVPVER